jgi:hypothetical protein
MLGMLIQQNLNKNWDRELCLGVGQDTNTTKANEQKLLQRGRKYLVGVEGGRGIWALKTVMAEL